MTFKKILILSANSKDTSKLRLDEEVRNIQTALKRAKNREMSSLALAVIATRILFWENLVMSLQKPIGDKVL
ncbi:hypothetical protein [Scytonema sp. PCC 10023]|uniref:hypothetical protein n=1 Tax=Scytonema sp. PCC 10023 TaxID=1680591 RepID=UPI0039C6FC5D